MLRCSCLTIQKKSPWICQALTIGTIPINSRQCLLSSSLLLSRTSTSRSELGSSSTLGSLSTLWQLLITNFCNELGRLGSDEISGQPVITNSCSELGRPFSFRRALHSQMYNLLRLGRLCSRSGRFCSLLQSIKLISSRELTNRRASCSFVKHSSN